MNSVAEYFDEMSAIWDDAVLHNKTYIREVLKLLKIKEGVLQSLLQDCPKTLARIEVNLFRKIITENIKNGASIEELFGKSRKIKNEKSRKNFQDNLVVCLYHS